MHEAGTVFMRQARGHTGRLAFSHPIDPIVISAYPANQVAADHPVAAMEREALPACVEHRAHFAIVAAREHEAQPLARVVGVAEKPRVTRTQARHVDGDVGAAVHRCAVRGRSENEKGGARSEYQPAKKFESYRTHCESMLSQRTPGVKARPHPSASLPLFSRSVPSRAGPRRH